MAFGIGSVGSAYICISKQNLVITKDMYFAVLESTSSLKLSSLSPLGCIKIVLSILCCWFQFAEPSKQNIANPFKIPLYASAVTPNDILLLVCSDMISLMMLMTMTMTLTMMLTMMMMMMMMMM
eukprot:1379117-Amphidinium_carterae.1